MPGATYPPRILEPIASDAGGSYITNPMPDAPTGTNAASVQGGFPPITMQPELSGGEPPLGQDMNGFLFLISSHSFYVQCGQTYMYDATLAATIGGYATGTILGMSDDTGLWLNVVSGNTSDPDTGGAGWVPIAAYGYATVTGLTGGVVALTTQQAKYGVIVLSGTLTSNLTVNFPETDQQWLVINNTTGAFTTTCKTAASGSTGVVVPQGGFSSPIGVYSVGDGNIYPTVAPLSVPISQAATPLTLAERTNAGYLLATYFNQSSGLENPPVGAVFVQSSSGDGYLRKITPANFAAQIALSLFNGQVSNGQVPLSAVSQWAAFIFADAALTGAPTAPTAANGTNSTVIASTAFVKNVAGISAVSGGFNVGIMQVRMGITASLAGGSNRINYGTGFSTGTIAVVVCPTVNSASWAVTAYDANGFNMDTGAAEPYFYIAIGN
jgi:hypothetical protein